MNFIKEYTIQKIKGGWEEIAQTTTELWGEIEKLAYKIAENPQIWIPIILILTFLCTQYLKRK